MDLTQKILKTVSRYEMFGRGDKILLGVSGGPDSVFLTYFLNSVKNKLGIKLFIAHMDHGVRGAASKKDADFVRRIAKKLKLKFITSKAKIKKSKLSLEEILREARYDFFRKSCKKLKINMVVTAHTLDDQAETVFMRVIKGSALKGLVGIHPVRRDKKIKFVRPLLEIEKEEIINYLKTRKISYRIDRTNLENKFLRNRIRNEIFPYLLSVNPRIKRSLFNLSESLREDFEFIELEKERRKNILKKGKKEHYIFLKDMLLQPKAIQREITREALKLIGANVKKLTYRHWMDVDNFIRKTPKNKSIDLPDGVKIRKKENSLTFSRRTIQ